MPTERQRLDPDTVSDAYRKFAAQIERFLRGVLRDGNLAEDVLQVTFTRFMERGAEVAVDSRKAWLFRVAFNEAMLISRRQGIVQRANEKIAQLKELRLNENALDESVAAAVHAEQVEQIRLALDKLTPEQAQIVRLRIYEGLKFADIANQLKMPLGTVLTRMRSSLQKLRRYVEP